MTRAARWSPALAKEVRAVLPFWGAAVATLAVGSVWQQRYLLDLGLFAYVVGSVAVGAQSVGQEYAHRTLPMLLSHPADRRRLYLLKFAVSAAMLATLAALAWNVLPRSVLPPEPQRAGIVFLPLLCGLFLAPLSTMVCRSPLAGMILSVTVPAVAWLVAIAIGWFGFGIDVEAAGATLLRRWLPIAAVLCPVAGLLGWRQFAVLEALDTASPGLHWSRRVHAAEGVRRYAPLRALAAKELRLQQPAFVVAGLNVAGWALLQVLRRTVPSWSSIPIEALMLLYSIGLAIMIGALASAEERQHGTLDGQLLQPTPGWLQWVIKIGVTFGLALACGVGLPVLLIQLTPPQGFSALGASADLTVLVILLTAGSLYISSLSGSGVRAMVWSLPAGMAVVYFVQMVGQALGWVTRQLAGPWMASIVTGAVAPPGTDAADAVSSTARGFVVALVPLLLWFGFLNHTTAERSARHVLRQAVSIALLIAAGVIVMGGLLALQELRSR